MTFVYNGYGELKTQTDAKGQSISFAYDKLGRMKRRNAPNIEDLWDYDHPDAIGQLEYMRRNQNGQTVYERDFSYDGFARATGHTTSINNTTSGQAQTFEVQIQPDGYFGRPVSMIYPTAFAAQALPLQTYHLYEINGYLKQEGLGRWLVDTPPGLSVPYYRKINNMSPRDQLVNVSYGNDAVDYWNYGPANGQMSEMISSVPGLPEKLADLEYSFDEFGNLDIQTNNLIDVEEQFNYDQLHRLISRNLAQMSATTPIDPDPDRAPAPDPQPKPFEFPEGVSYSYDALGNILTKSDYADSYEYDHVKHQICANSGLNSLAEHPGPHAVTQVTAQVKSFNGGTTPQDYRMAYDANGNLICSEDGNLTVQYDAFNLPTHIQRDFITQTFHYGPDLQRYRQDSSGAETLYIDKLYERKGNIERYYLGGYLVIERSSAGIDKQSFTHKDRLGSTVAITDAAGDIKVQQGFGPFGKARTANWDATDFLPGRNHDSRGFTDHEHLENTRLIHMNGRAYDFNLGRFLSIDPIIQFPENSQSLNPYSYLMNNPMAGTDPTGYSRVGLEAGSASICGANAGAGSCSSSTELPQNSESNNGKETRKTQGNTNTGSGLSGGGDSGSISSLMSDSSKGNQESFSPRAQTDEVDEAEGLPLPAIPPVIARPIDLPNTGLRDPSITFRGSARTLGAIIGRIAGVGIGLLTFPPNVACAQPADVCIAQGLEPPAPIEGMRGPTAALSESDEAVDGLIDSADDIRTTKGGTDIKEKSGGTTQRDKDAGALGIDFDDKGGGVRAGETGSGRRVIVRDKSSDGRPTIEIQRPDGRKLTEIRYND